VETLFHDSNLWPVKYHRRQLMWFYIPVMYFQDVRQATMVPAPKPTWTTTVGRWTHKTQCSRAVIVRQATMVLAPKPTWTTTVGRWTHKTQSTRSRSDESRWSTCSSMAKFIHMYCIHVCLEK